jgi:LysR family transcriptional regulator for metE and metH
MDLEVRHLRLVDMIAREGSVTAASVKLYVTQSALSHQLHEIETKLGTPLFLRSRRKMILTEAGRQVLSSAQIVIKELSSTEESVRRLANGNEGLLRLSTQCNTCYHWLPDLIRRFKKKYPQVDVQINVEATRDPLHALWNGELDLAIVYAIPIKKGLKVYPLFHDELMAIMHPQHPLAKKQFLTARDFSREHLIAYMTPTEESLLFQKVLTPSGVWPRKVTQVMLSEAILEMIKADLGIGVMSQWFTAPYVRSKMVSAVRITRKGLIRHWVGAAIARKDVPSYIEEFTQLLAESSLPAQKQR